MYMSTIVHRSACAYALTMRCFIFVYQQRRVRPRLRDDLPPGDPVGDFDRRWVGIMELKSFHIPRSVLPFRNCPFPPLSTPHLVANAADLPHVLYFSEVREYVKNTYFYDDLLKTRICKDEFY